MPNEQAPKAAAPQRHVAESFVPHNPRLAEQMAKRKQLWINAAAMREAEAKAKLAAAEAAKVAAANGGGVQTANSWETVEFAQDDAGTQASKFLRLMGMKNAEAAAGVKAADKSGAAVEKDPDAVAKRAQMFSNMERQYETARKTTHNAKGKGFGSAGPQAQKKYF